MSMVVWTVAAALSAIFIGGVVFGAAVYAGVKLGTRWFGPWRTVVYKDWGAP